MGMCICMCVAAPHRRQGSSVSRHVYRVIDGHVSRHGYEACLRRIVFGADGVRRLAQPGQCPMALIGDGETQWAVGSIAAIAGGMPIAAPVPLLTHLSEGCPKPALLVPHACLHGVVQNGSVPASLDGVDGARQTAEHAARTKAMPGRHDATQTCARQSAAHGHCTIGRPSSRRSKRVPARRWALARHAVRRRPI